MGMLAMTELAVVALAVPDYRRSLIETSSARAARALAADPGFVDFPDGHRSRASDNFGQFGLSRSFLGVPGRALRCFVASVQMPHH
jgi:hypothetical protein